MGRRVYQINVGGPTRDQCLRFGSSEKPSHQSVPGTAGTSGRRLNAVHHDAIDALNGCFVMLVRRAMMGVATVGATTIRFLLPQLLLLVPPLGAVMLFPIPLGILPADVVAALFA
jgi:hypothetical protein